MILNKIKYFVFLGLILLGSCTKNFDKINTNPTKLNQLSPDALLTQSILHVSSNEGDAWRNNLIYNSQFTQQFASINWSQGDKYIFDEGYNSSIWYKYYQDALKNLVQLIENTKSSPNDVNYNSAAKIMRAVTGLRLTDMYGDVPYSEAGNGYITNNYKPKYDEQRTILLTIVDELDAAAKAFDSAKPFSGDITNCNGNVALWKKAAYSLMLRVGMRFSKREPAKAQEIVNKAVSGGLINDYTETFRINHISGNYDNPNSHVLGFYNGGRNELSANSFKFSKFFMDLLQSKADPRLKMLSVVRTGATNTSVVGTENDDPAVQKGLQNGTNPSGFTGIATYSQLRSTFADADDPNIFISHAQTQFLLAEARERGWISTGTSESYFRTGVKSAINQLKLYNPGASLFDDAATDAYATSIAYPAATADRLNAINTQYYIASFMDFYEVHANWRRSGYPVLTPVNFTGNYTGGVIPRRFQYPSSEPTYNKENYTAAVARQGADKWTTPVWWDKAN